MITLLVISTVATLALLAVSVSEAGGAPVSLSSTYYNLREDGWVFQVLLAATAASLLPVWVQSSSDGLEWLAFLSCASLLFVAAAPAFRLELEGKIHYTSAAVCCVCAVWWQAAEGLWDITLWWAAMALMLSLGWKDKWCWWLECAVIGSAYMNLFRLI